MPHHVHNKEDKSWAMMKANLFPDRTKELEEEIQKLTEENERLWTENYCLHRVLANGNQGTVLVFNHTK